MADPSRILVVDDEADILFLIQEVLEPDGHDIETASTATEAMELLRGGGFRCAIVDKNLPDASGLDVIRVAKEVDPFIEAILITGYASLESAIEALELDVFDYIVKPFTDSRQLRIKVRQAINKQQLAHEKQALVEFLETVTGSMGTGLLVLDVEGRLQAANPAARTILELDSEVSFFPGAGPPLSALIGESAASVLRNPTELVAGQHSQADAQLELPSGVSVEVGFTTKPLTDKSGRNLGVVVNCRDLAGVKKLREAERRRERLAALGEMSARIAHEIRNPLVSIDSVVQLLKEELPDNKQATDDLQLIASEVRRLHHIVSDFLGFARPSPIDPAPGDLTAVLAEGVRQVEPQFSDKGVSLALSANDDLPAVRIDSNRMKQVFLNVLLNALDATPPGGRVEARSEVQDGGVANGVRVRVIIDDGGPGISGEHLAQLFQPFFSTKSRGTGLGLAISKSIVEEHGGAIYLVNRTNGGARAEIELPV